MQLMPFQTITILFFITINFHKRDNNALFIIIIFLLLIYMLGVHVDSV